jgi:hypothetical protein
MADGLTKPLARILFYRHRDFTMGFVPPVYSPKYNEVAKIYTVPDTTTMTVDSRPKPLVAAAAKTTASWSKVVQSMYLMPLSFVRSDSSLSPERGGVTDTYDLPVPSRSSLPVTYTVDRDNDILVVS